MALEKITKLSKLELNDEAGMLFMETVDVITDGGIEISRTVPNRAPLYPDTDVSNYEPIVQQAFSAYWTTDRINAFNAVQNPIVDTIS